MNTQEKPKKKDNVVFMGERNSCIRWNVDQMLRFTLTDVEKKKVFYDGDLKPVKGVVMLLDDTDNKYMFSLYYSGMTNTNIITACEVIKAKAVDRLRGFEEEDEG